MRKTTRNRRFFSISGSFYLYISVLLLTLPLRWVFAFGICAATHELFHILSARIMGISIDRMEITPGGARIQTGPMTAAQELLCSIAGPIGGLLPALLLRYFPEMALIALLLTLYNLLPLYPADGARVLQCGLRLLISDKLVQKFSVWAERIVRCILIALGLYGTLILRLGLFPFVASMLLVLRGKMQKHLANSGQTQYNIPTMDQEVAL